MDVRNVVLGFSGHADLRHDVALLDVRTTPYEHRADVCERRLVAVGRRDGDGQAIRRHLTCECDLPGSRRPDPGRSDDPNVDSAMLASRVGVVAEGERAQDRPVGRPDPGSGRGRGSRRPHERGSCSDDGEAECARCP
jgi:hypothetical protein